MTGKWFDGVKDIETLRKRYRELLKVYHPDNSGGNEEIMKQINTAYDRLFAQMSHENKSDGESCTEQETAENEAFKRVLERIGHINAEVEIVGSWIWVEKGSYEYRQLLKEVGFRYASRKQAWYWHCGTFYKRNKKELSLDEIRMKYGSQTVNNRQKQFALD